MIKDTNYVNIQGWMLTKLNLKGNDLMVFAIIYGFSQVENHYFNGSLSYLSEWTNSTRQGVLKNLKNLIEQGFIVKHESSPTNIYCVNSVVIDEYVNSVDKDVNKVDTALNSVDTSVKQSSPNNIINTNNNLDNKYIKERDLRNSVDEIIDYFNKVCGSKFRSNSKATIRLVRGRLNEGFTVDDFKRVIDTKYKEWGISPKPFGNGIMSNEYLRPTTLFGDKFETYLYESSTRESSEGPYNSVSVEVDPNRSNLVF